MSADTPTMPAPETHAFQAEIRQVLDIVIHSLYTHREIFVRELISNAADALEKFRHESLIHKDFIDPHKALEIVIEGDETAKTFTITDTGVGMTHDDLVTNLGTIAHSGTKEFLARMAEAKQTDVGLIGQFGVGFYSAFMVAKKVTVETRSYHSDSQGWEWTSEGTGSYTITPREGLTRGTRIILELKDDALEFARKGILSEIIHRFSNFVPFPILVGEERLNTVQALWMRNKADVKDEEYTEFYKFIAGDHQEPLLRFHFSADVPLSINSLLFVPKDSMERLGFGRMKPGVDLHCRKVLIQKHPDNLLPEWMRFVRGVVDSEDLPLNISRETMQDNSLVRKLSKTIAGKFLKFLAEVAKNEEEKYAEFYKQFGNFLKEGATQDYAHREELAKLLRFESTTTEPGKTTSLADYVSRMKDGQKAIYFVNGASRASAEGSPYLEAFKSRDIEVLFTLDPYDDFVLNNLMEFDGTKLTSADSGDLELPEKEEEKRDELSREECETLCGWLKQVLGERIGSVRASKRLTSSPAVVTTDGGMSSAMHRVMMALDREKEKSEPGARMTLEINPAHGLLHRVFVLRASDEPFARELAEQLLDNALLGAGLLTDPRRMLDRMNDLLTRAAGK